MPWSWFGPQGSSLTQSHALSLSPLTGSETRRIEYRELRSCPSRPLPSSTFHFLGTLSPSLCAWRARGGEEFPLLLFSSAYLFTLGSLSLGAQQTCRKWTAAKSLSLTVCLSLYLFSAIQRAEFSLLLSLCIAVLVFGAEQSRAEQIGGALKGWGRRVRFHHKALSCRFSNYFEHLSSLFLEASEKEQGLIKSLEGQFTKRICSSFNSTETFHRTEEGNGGSRTDLLSFD